MGLAEHGRTGRVWTWTSISTCCGLAFHAHGTGLDCVQQDHSTCACASL